MVRLSHMMPLRTLGLMVLTMMACSPALNMVRWSPARFNLGVGRTILVARVDAPDFHRQLLRTTLEAQLMQSGAFRVRQRAPAGPSDLGWVLLPDWLRIPEEASSLAAFGDADLYVFATVRDTKAQLETVATGDGGSAQQLKAKVRVSFKVVDRQGNLRAADAYSGNATSQGDDALAELSEAAIGEVVRAFVHDVTARQVGERVEFAEGSLYELGIQAAAHGDLDRAIAHFSQLTERMPYDAGAHYNLALVLEAKGDFAGAHSHYREAVKHTDRALYSEGLAGFERRQAELHLLERG